MHITVKNLLDIENSIKAYLEEINLDNYPNIIAVSKTFNIDKILPLIEHGHINFGENKVQEAVEKWTEIKKANSKIKLHMIGKLQTNKVKFAVKLFDYIHAVDRVNIGNENQKSGINKEDLNQLVSYCKEIDLDLIGLMCIPPVNADPRPYFEEMNKLNRSLGFTELSMGMSSDFLLAVKYLSTYVRIGSRIFGERS